MFADVFIHFLLVNNIVNEKQAKQSLFKRDTKVRPSTIAVYENLMTEAQVKTVMELQELKDMPFGFLAVREGYLTHEQVAAISGRRSREDMLVMQTLFDKGFLSMNESIENFKLFKEHFDLDDEAYEELVANKPESYIEHIAGVTDGGLFSKFASVFLKTFTMCIDSSLRIEKAYTHSHIEGKYLVMVECDGDRSFTLGMAMDDENSILSIAGRFVRQQQREYCEDVEDSLKEFLNIVAGMFVTVLERDFQLDVDLFAPEMSINGSFATDKHVNIIDAHSFDSSSKFFFAEN